MSIKKTQQTDFTDGDQEVVFRLSALRLDSIANKQNLRIWCELLGFIGSAEKPVDKYAAHLTLSSILDGFTATEKTAAKKFLTAIERVAKEQIEDLESGTYDSTDTF